MSTSRILSVCCAWLFVLASVSLPALAHQQKEAITRVLFNARTGNIEVMHRVLLHDAEHAMQRRFGTTFDLIGRASDRDAFERYVHGRFSLSDQTGMALTLAPVGSELDHDYLWVYAETAIPDGLSSLTITHDVLRDVWATQSNLVNVERDGKIRSAVFNGGQPEITMDL